MQRQVSRTLGLRVSAPLLTWLIAGTMTSFGTPPLDPICAAPSSFQAVENIRAEIAAKGKATRPALALQGPAQPPRLTWDGWDASNVPRLKLAGPVGEAFHLESTSDLKLASWQRSAAVRFEGQPITLRDDSASGLSHRFYRLAPAGAELLAEPVDNFRLLDHEGKARELFYPSHLKAVVAVAAGDNLQRIASLVPILQQLAATYGSQIETWVLLSDPAAKRTNVAAQAQALGLTFPVVLDGDGLAAGAVRLTRAGEAVVVEPPGFTVAYRGAVTDGSTSDAEQTFLGQALARVTAAQPLSLLRTPVNGPALADASALTPDYARDVAPILHRHCAICHRPNDVAPFALTNYSVVRTWAASMKHAVLSRKMPPWHVDPEYGHWSNDLSMPGSAKQILIRWLNAGAPRGTGPDPLAELPPPPAFTDWPADLGEPDLLMSPPLQQIKATGSEEYRYIFVQAPVPSNVWLRAAIVRPSNPRAVHHYLVWPGQIGNTSPIDGISSYQGSLAGYVPGSQPYRLPPDTGISLSRSNWLTFNLHYTPYGEATTDLPVLALWFHRTPPAKKFSVVGITNPFFSIPPGDPEHPVQVEWRATRTTRIHQFNPHMHLRGKRMSFEAIYPNGQREMLLSVPDYDFNWQTGYDLAEPKTVPAGTRILVRGAFDNSPQNLANPDPTATVFWGDQSWYEMFVGFMGIAE